MSGLTPEMVVNLCSAAERAGAYGWTKENMEAIKAAVLRSLAPLSATATIRTDFDPSKMQTDMMLQPIGGKDCVTGERIEVVHADDCRKMELRNLELARDLAEANNELAAIMQTLGEAISGEGGLHIGDALEMAKRVKAMLAAAPAPAQPRQNYYAPYNADEEGTAQPVAWRVKWTPNADWEHFGDKPAPFAGEWHCVEPLYAAPTFAPVEAGTPDAYAVRMADGHWVGLWNDKEVAALVASKQPKGEVVWLRCMKPSEGAE